MRIEGAAITVRIGDRLAGHIVFDISLSETSGFVYLHTAYRRTPRSKSITDVLPFSPLDQIVFDRFETRLADDVDE